MKRLSKTKKGFTLLEIIMVIAIIMILAATVAISASGILNSAHRGQDSVANRVVKEREGIAQQESRLKQYGF